MQEPCQQHLGKERLYSGYRFHDVDKINREGV